MWESTSWGQSPQAQCPVCGTINDTSGNMAQGYYSQTPTQQGHPQQTFPQPQAQQGYPQQPYQQPQVQQGYQQPYQQAPAQTGYYQQTPGQYQMQQGYGGPVPTPGFAPVGGGEAIGAAFRIYGRHFGKFFLFWLMTGVVVIGINFLPYLFSMGRDPGEASAGPESVAFAFLPLFSYALLFLFSAGLLSMTREAMEKGKVSFVTGFIPFREYALRVLGTTIAVYVILIIGFILCIIPALIFCYWYFFAVTAVVIENRTILDALRRSKQFSQDHGALGFIILLIIVETLLAILLFGASVAGWFAYYGPESFLMAICFGIIISPVLFWFVAPIGFIATAYYFIKGTGLVRDDQIGGPADGMNPQIPASSPQQIYQQYYQPPQ